MVQCNLHALNRMREKKGVSDAEVYGKVRLFGSAVASVRKLCTKGKGLNSGIGQMHSDQISRVNYGVTKTLTDIGGNPASRVVTRERSVILSRARAPLSLLSSTPVGTFRTLRRAEFNNMRRKSLDDPEGQREWPHDLFQDPVATCPGSAIFVRNLPSSVTEEQLRKLFQKVGNVVSIKVDHGPLPTARVGFLKRYSAPDAVVAFMGYKLQGKPLKICVLEPSKPQPPQDEAEDDDDFYTQNYPMWEPWNPYFVGHVMKKTRKSALRSDTPRISVFDRLN